MLNKYTQGSITVYAENFEEAMRMINDIRELEREMYLEGSEYPCYGY